MTFATRVLVLRLRRTWRDYRRIWRPDTRSRFQHLRKCWRAARVLIVVDGATRTIYEVK
jgi:hypothetical protein